MWTGPFRHRPWRGRGGVWTCGWPPFASNYSQFPIKVHVDFNQDFFEKFRPPHRFSKVPNWNFRHFCFVFYSSPPYFGKIPKFSCFLIMTLPLRQIMGLRTMSEDFHKISHIFCYEVINNSWVIGYFIWTVSHHI